MMPETKSLDLNTVVVRQQDLVFSEIDNDLVIMSIANSKYYGAESVGRRIWTLIEHPIKVADVCAVLVDEFEVDNAVCERDALAFLGQLMDEKLLKIENAQTDSSAS